MSTPAGSAMDRSTGRTAVVTGGAGFIGSRLVRQLLADGWRVWVLDNFSTGRRESLGAAAAHPACRVIPAHVSDPVAVTQVLAEAQPAALFHLAAIHFIPACERDPVRALTTNVTGTQVVLGAIEKHPGCRLVFASTGDVYAVSAAPHDELSDVGPTSFYGITKLMAEQLVRRATSRGIDCRIARLFNVFGPGDRTPHVLPDMVNGLAGAGPLALGRLDPVRDYTYVDDVADALRLLAQYDGDKRVFNIGSGNGRSVRDLVDAVRAVSGMKISVTIDPAKLRPVDRPALVSDPGRARTLLNWVPQVAFADGIRRLLAAELVGVEP
jgi:UDP-glucose 4-epimerase